MRRPKRQSRTVKNPDSMILGIAGGIGLLAVVGFGVYFAMKASQGASATAMVAGSQSTPNLVSGSTIPTSTVQSNRGIGQAQPEQRVATGLAAGSRVRRGQSFHLRTIDTSSNRGAVNITDNPTLELLARGTSVRNPNEQMWQVRIVDGPNGGQVGWTFILPNEQIS